MAGERGIAYLWLPLTFVVEVVAWEVGSRLELALVDPTWEELGRTIDVEQIAWLLGSGALLVFALFASVTRHHRMLQVSIVQLAGVLALACYWVGASVLASGTAVGLSSIAAWLLGRRPARAGASTRS